jgi:hypothetical protein
MANTIFDSCSFLLSLRAALPRTTTHTVASNDDWVQSNRGLKADTLLRVREIMASGELLVKKETQRKDVEPSASVGGVRGARRHFERFGQAAAHWA